MSKRPPHSKVSHHPRLTNHERRVAKEFISAAPSAAAQSTYESAWDIELESEALREGRGPVDKIAQCERARHLRIRAHKLVPSARRAAAPAHIEIHRAALRYLRYCGGIDNFNITHFVKYVHSRPNARRVYKTGRSSKLSDHAIRAILKQRLDIILDPGRKRKKR